MKSKRQELIERVRPLKDQPGVFDALSLLEACIDEWKEELINAKDDTVPELQGAIKKVRIVLYDIRKDLPKNDYKTGAYSGES